MAVKKTQKELEQTVKGYQLDAVEIKVDQAIAKLDVLISQTQGIITQEQLRSAINEFEVDIKEYVSTKVAEEVKKIHLEYRPTKKGAWWVLATVSAAVIGNLVLTVRNVFGGM